MAGRKQHYLPQFLQRPFSHIKSKHKHYVYVFRKDGVFTTETAGIGAERDFYSGIEDTTADSLITLAEGEQGAFLNAIYETYTIDDQSKAAVLFASLSIRTNASRQALIELAPRMLSTIKEKATEEKLILDNIHDYLSRPESIEEAISEELKKHEPMHREQRFRMKLLIKQKFQSELPDLAPKWVKEFRELASSLLSELEFKSSEIADSSFLKIFQSTDSIDRRSSWFKEFKYEIGSSDIPLILGDCAVISIDSLSIPRLPVANQDDEIRLEQLYLPISPNKYLIGKRSNSIEELSPSEINLYSARLSRNFFICAERSEESERLKSDISVLSDPILSLTEMRSLIS